MLYYLLNFVIECLTIARKQGFLIFNDFQFLENVKFPGKC